jgi:hypothetical protein
MTSYPVSSTSPQGSLFDLLEQVEEYEVEAQKIRARSAVASAIRSGRLQRGVRCEVCGSTRDLEAHHPDHSRPLDVVWLDPLCHRRVHLGRLVLPPLDPWLEAISAHVFDPL